MDDREIVFGGRSRVTSLTFLPPTLSAEERVAALAQALNETIKQLHEQGKVVLVGDVDICHPGQWTLPQIRVDVRDPEDIVGRPEGLDV
jgi:2-phospho-L-lactate guanylyltransferase (CobY/MobA/RfbA family)